MVRALFFFRLDDNRGIDWEGKVVIVGIMGLIVDLAEIRILHFLFWLGGYCVVKVKLRGRFSTCNDNNSSFIVL